MQWILLVILILIFFLFFVFWFSKKKGGQPPPGKDEASSVQVVNNSSVLLNMVKIGAVEFSENLKMCADGCSTGFKNVEQGDNPISAQTTDDPGWAILGNLGPFNKNTHYAVNIVLKASDQVCAELWKRNQTDSTFNDDTTKELITTVCLESAAPSTLVVNNSGSLIYRVKVGEVEFSENLQLCATGCATGFIDVVKGNNTIQFQETSGSAWQDLGSLGPFDENTHYAVNIKNTGSFCAELWKITQTDVEFNNDTSKELFVSNC